MCPTHDLFVSQKLSGPFLTYVVLTFKWTKYKVSTQRILKYITESSLARNEIILGYLIVTNHQSWIMFRISMFLLWPDMWRHLSPRNQQINPHPDGPLDFPPPDGKRGCWERPSISAPEPRSDTR